MTDFDTDDWEERVYEMVAAEIARGEYKPGLQAKAIAETDGDEAKAKARYLLLRAFQIVKELEQHAEQAAQREAERLQREREARQAAARQAQDEVDRIVREERAAQEKREKEKQAHERERLEREQKQRAAEQEAERKRILQEQEAEAARLAEEEHFRLLAEQRHREELARERARIEKELLQEEYYERPSTRHRQTPKPRPEIQFPSPTRSATTEAQSPEDNKFELSWAQIGTIVILMWIGIITLINVL